jgi:glycosidase
MRFAHVALIAGLLVAAGCRSTPPLPAPRGVATASDTGWVGRSALYEVFVRDFSPAGTFQGVTNGLDRIAASGANVLWLMPVFPIGVEHRKGTLGSPYAVRDYLAVNPDFGTEADFRALVDAAHARDLKVILDWVPNHTAWDAVWVEEHPDYFVRDASGGLIPARDENDNPTDWTDVAELDYDNPDLRRAMTEAMRHWLVEYGVDGFRVDVTRGVPWDYWHGAIPALRSSVAGEILLLAETGDMEAHRQGFDLTYAWDTYRRLKLVWQGAPAETLVVGEVADMAVMPRGGMRLRFTTNHDETAWDAPPLSLFQGISGARAAFVAVTMLPGRPLLYNGQEVESPQVLRLFERDPVEWSRPGADSARAFYRHVIALNRNEPDLVAGRLEPVTTSAPADVIAYRRGRLVVLVNARPAEVRITLPVATIDGATDLLSGRVQQGREVVLPAWGALVLKPAGS